MGLYSSLQFWQVNVVLCLNKANIINDEDSGTPELCSPELPSVLGKQTME
jgi:hypothetical protein